MGKLFDRLDQFLQQRSIDKKTVTALERNTLLFMIWRRNWKRKRSPMLLPEIAEYTNCSDRSTRRVLKNLEEKGLITIVRRTLSNGGTAENFYQLKLRKG